MANPKKSSHSRAGRLVDEGVHQHLPEHALDELIAEFIDLVNSRNDVFKDFSKDDIAWCRVIFVLIGMGGIAGPNALAELFQLRYRDVITSVKGYISLPRAGGHYPIFLPEQASVFVLSLCGYLSRKRGPGRNRIGEFPLDGFILLGLKDPTTPPSVDKVQNYRDKFRSWLMILGKKSGFYLPVGRFIALAKSKTSGI